MKEHGSAFEAKQHRAGHDDAEHSGELQTEAGIDALSLPMESASAATPGPPTQDPPPPSSNEAIQQPLLFKARQVLLDRFEVVRPLGVGGMGAVFLAWDRRLDRRVAIKTLRVKHAVASQRARWERVFRREASSIARLQHPNILVLHDFGQIAHIPYLILEYLEGRTLHQCLLQTSVFEVRRALQVGEQLAGALAHAHAQNIVHRDLKPSNIFVAPDGHVKIMDFGLALLQADRARLAKAFGTSVAEVEARLGTSPQRAGTPLYMAPEQLLGAPQDARVDVWGLGVVLFEMLTGQRPFKTLQSVLEGSPPALDALPAALRDVVGTCLSLSPEGRPASMVEVADRLRQHREAMQARHVPVSVHVDRIPRFDDTFIGRQHELDRLNDACATGQRCITVLGPSGCGKTRLVSEWARAIQRDWDEVIFCSLVDVTSADGLIRAVAESLQVRLTQRDPSLQLARVMAVRERVLLILDNVEQISALVASHVTQWLTHAPLIGCVLTSRHALGIDDEHVVELGPFDTSPGSAGLEAAIELFVIRAHAHGARKIRRVDMRETLASLVRTLDGLPLAIELAAARSRVLSPQKMLDRMHRRFDLLKSRRRDLSGRQATLYGALEWSWELLEPWEQSALAQASVFEGGFSLDAAEAVINLAMFRRAPFMVEVLQSLIDKNLLRNATSSDDAVPYYGMLVSIHAFASEKRLQSAALWSEPAMVRHGQFFAPWGRARFEKKLSGRLRADAIHAVGRSFGNLDVACQRALERSDMTMVYDLVQPMHAYLATHGPYRVGRALLEKVIRRGHFSNAQSAALHTWRGWVRGLTGDVDGMREDYHHALALAQDLDDPSRLSEAVGACAIVEKQRGDNAAAEAGFRRALTIAQSSGDDRNASVWLGSLAILMHETGRLDDARAAYGQAITYATAAHDLAREATHRGNLANLDTHQGHYRAALTGYQRVHQLVEMLNDRRRTCNILISLAQFEQNMGDLDNCEQRLRQALDIAQQLGDPLYLSRAHGALGELWFCRGDTAAARVDLDRALTLADMIDNRRQASLWLSALAYVHSEEGEHDDARACLQQALELARALQNRRLEARYLNDMTEVLISGGDTAQAREFLDKAEVGIQAVNDRFQLALFHARAAYLAHVEGQEQTRVVEHLDQAYALRDLLGVPAHSMLAEKISRVAEAVMTLRERPGA